MTKRRNAGEGYGFMFHGAFSKKADAVKKEKKRKGSFIKGMPTAKGYRYIVFTPRTNPRRKKKKQNPMDLLVMGANPGHSSHEITVQPGQVITLRVNPAMEANPFGLGDPQGQAFLDCFDKDSETYHSKKCQSVRRRTKKVSGIPPWFAAGANPSGQICGHMVQGYACTREPGHAGPHLPQGATLRPASRHNWGRSNPSAETLRETFTGRPAGRISIFDEPLMPAGDYALLGKLLTLYVKPLSGGQILQINGRGVQVVADESARQIWLVGGDQDVSEFLEKFGARQNPDAGAGYYELGEAIRIDYKQRKEHVPKPELDEWKHYFGHENEVRPRVFFDVNHKRLALEGGDYRIEERGIIN